MRIPYLERFPDVPVLLCDQLDRCAVEFGDRLAGVDQYGKLTWSQLRRMVNLIAAELSDRGVNPGDRIAISMERRLDIVIAYLAVSRAGAVAVPVNFKSTRREQLETLALIEPVGTIYHDDIARAVEPLEGEGWRLVIDSPAWKTRFQQAETVSDTDHTGDWPDRSPDDPVYLNMTSGSTGTPKAAIATHRQLYGNTRACVERFDLTEEDVHLPLFAVMSHPHEIFCRALFTGAAIVLVENLYPRTIAEMIDMYGVTCIMAVSPVYSLMLPFITNKRYDFSSLRLPESGGMSTPPALETKFRELTGVSIVPVWGSTETMGVAFASSLDGSTPAGSVGQVMPGYQARIIDKNNHDVPVGETGELLIRGSGVSDGYWRDPATTQAAFENGWYRTGDLFELDDAGNYFFRGRLDAMIKAGGFKIYPAEIEAALFSHPLVREAVVVPFDDRLRGLVPLAVLVTEPGESLTEAQLRHFLANRLPRQKLPRIFRFLPDLPRTASGKVDRKALLSFGSLDYEPSEVTLERRLDAIDLKILHLLNERMRIEMQLMQKQKDGKFQPERMQETLQRIAEFNPGPLHDSIVEEIFRHILSLRTLY
ncbi:MAG TPA: AMP-binding protein [bacterium]|nr:AMP-binding protein [bacterium]